jgi:hypothetical protein
MPLPLQVDRADGETDENYAAGKSSVQPLVAGKINDVGMMNTTKGDSAAVRTAINRPACLYTWSTSPIFGEMTDEPQGHV